MANGNGSGIPREHRRAGDGGVEREGRYHEAEQAAGLQLAVEPDNLQALQILGAVAGLGGRPEEALRIFRQALTRHRDEPTLHLNVIATLGRLGRHREALAQTRRLIGLQPEAAASHFTLGNCQRDLGRHDAAEQAYREALARDPDHALSHVALAELLLREPARREDARRHLLEARRLDPDLDRVASLLRSLDAPPATEPGQPTILPDAARRRWRRRVPHVPEVRTWIDRGIAALDSDEGEALHCFIQALALQADNPEAAFYLAGLQERNYDAAAVLQTLERHHEDLVATGLLFDTYIWALRRTNQEALALNELLRRADAEGLSPGQWLTYYRLALQVADWRLWESVQERAIRPALAHPPVGYAWDALTLPFDAAGLAALARAQSDAIAARAGEPLPPFDPIRVRERIHVGYVTGDIKDHASMHLAGRMYGRHDPQRFKVHVYNTGSVDGSHWEETVRAGADVCRSVKGQSGRAIAHQIRADGIDILVDQGGYTGFARPDVLALRPAPVQAHWFVTAGSLAAPWLDYFIADPFVIDDALRPHFPERIAYLPHCYMPTDREQVIADDLVTKRDQGLPPAGFVFACLNNTYKLTPAAFAVWMRLLRAIPGSVLWLLGGSDLRLQNLARHARNAGVDPGRLVYAQRLPKPAHLARHRLADLFLDTEIYGGHTSTVDALWAGRPVLTVAGRTFASRAAASMLRAMGLADLVCADWSEYESVALALARDPARLHALQARVDANRLTTPLFDSNAYIRGLEQLYVLMLRRRRNGEPPADIRVT
jgi:protein O-GlcNAc transferase